MGGEGLLVIMVPPSSQQSPTLNVLGDSGDVENQTLPIQLPETTAHLLSGQPIREARHDAASLALGGFPSTYPVSPLFHNLCVPKCLCQKRGKWMQSAECSKNTTKVKQFEVVFIFKLLLYHGFPGPACSMIFLCGKM